MSVSTFSIGVISPRHSFTRIGLILAKERGLLLMMMPRGLITAVLALGVWHGNGLRCRQGTKSCQSYFPKAAREFQAVTEQVEASCSSPAAICYWFTVSLVAWGGLSLIGIYWRPLQASSAAACLFAMAIGCLANWLRNRTFHCAITGPLFLIGGLIFLLSGVRAVQADTRWVWPVVLVGIGIAFPLEWRYGKHPAS